MTERIAKKRASGHGALYYWQLYLMLLPAVAYIGLFNYGPLYGIQIAFKEFRTDLGIWGSAWTGVSQFAHFLTYKDFWLIFGNTVELSLYNIAVGFPMPVILALMINEISNAKLKKTAQLITYMPYFVSTVVECGLVLIFLNQSNGIINHALAALGYDRIPFMTKPEYFKTIYVLSDVWKSCGWNTIIFLVALTGVSQESIESAKVDGASRLRIILSINIPHILPTVIIMLILRTGRILSVGHEKVLLLVNDLNIESANIISYYSYRVGLQGADFSYSTAIGLFNNVANLIALLIVNAIASKVSETSLF